MHIQTHSSTFMYIQAHSGICMFHQLPAQGWPPLKRHPTHNTDAILSALDIEMSAVDNQWCRLRRLVSQV